MTMGRSLFRLGNGLMLLLFATAAAVEYNDPDPWFWMGVYGAGALCCALFLAGRLPTVVSGLVTVGCLLGGLYLAVRIVFGPVPFFDVTGEEMMGLMEGTREMFGFLITALWTGILTWRARSPSASASPAPTA